MQSRQVASRVRMDTPVLSSNENDSISLVLDGNDRVRSVSPSIEQVFGLDPSGLHGEPINSIIDPYDRERFSEFLRTSRRPTELDLRLAVRVMDATSRPVWVEASAHPVGDFPGADRVVNLRPYLARTPDNDSERVELDSNRFHALVQNSADIVLVVDPDGTIRFVNPAMLRTLGLAPDDLLGTQILEIIHADDQVQVTEMMVSVLEQPEASLRVEFRARHANGSYRWIDGRAQNLLGHPEVGGILGNGRDITDRRLAEVALRASEERFRGLAASSPSAIFELDQTGHVTYGNVRWHEITGRGIDDELCVWSVMHDDDAVGLRDDWDSRYWPEGIDSRVRVLRPDGSQRWVEVRTRPVSAGMDDPAGHVGTLHDVTDLQHYQDELAHMALHDPLTALPNRVLLLDRLEQALARSRGSGRELALLFVDLDRFKVVNDSLGHHAGDEVLVTLARRLMHLVRPGDLVTRFGGDEFVILCEGIGHRDQALELAERLQQRVGGRVDIGDAQVHVSVSIGVVVGTGDEAPGDLLRDADAAMYEAKTRGRNRTQVFDDELHLAAVSRLSIEQELRLGMDRGEFTLYFQPIVGLGDDFMLGAEALLRWQHPEKGLLTPDEFLEVADESGVLAALGSWIIETACRSAVTWPEGADGQPLKVFVNLSGGQLANPGLTAEVTRVLDVTGIDPARVHLEVTEGTLLAGAGGAARVLHELRSLGVRIAIDDFGTGYSSLSYLTRLPVDLLKIDRSFVIGMVNRTDDREVTAAIVALARTLGLQSIAEGVETQAQLDALRALGCDAAQGFLFSAAVPSAAVGAMAVTPKAAPDGTEPERGDPS